MLDNVRLNASYAACTSCDKTVHVHFVVKAISNNVVDVEDMLGAMCRVNLSRPDTKWGIDIAFACKRLPARREILNGSMNYLIVGHLGKSEGAEVLSRQRRAVFGPNRIVPMWKQRRVRTVRS